MTLTYIFHSGFVLETDKSILIFDYWLDLNGVVPPFLKKDKPVYVFSSHFHEVSPTFSPRTSTSIGEPTRKMLTYGWPRVAHGLTAHYPFGH